jgi:hypothetical protein
MISDQRSVIVLASAPFKYLSIASRGHPIEMLKMDSREIVVVASVSPDQPPLSGPVGMLV